MLGEPLELVPRIERYIAFEVLLQRLRYVKRAVAETRLSRVDAKELAEYAACQWYPGDGARRAAEQLSDRGRSQVIAVDCASNDCAARLVRRGGFETQFSGNWHVGRVDAHWIPGEPANVLIANIGSELASDRHLGVSYERPEDVRAALSKHMEDEIRFRYPAVFWTILPPATGDDVVAALHDAYPQLGIVVLGLPRSSAVTILLDGARARSELAAFDRLCQDLDRMFPSQRRAG
jgi:hypothetical protein